MNRFYSILGLMLAFSVIAVPAMAQSQASIGLKAGFTAANLRGDDAGNLNWRNGFVGGLFVHIPVASLFAIQPEALFRQRGAYNSFEFSNIEQRINLTYIDIPVLFKLRVPIADIVYPHIYAGPQGSFSLKGEYEVDLYNGATFSDQIDVRKFDFGGVFGFGVDVVTDKLFFTADFRYGIGALKIDKSDNGLDLKNKDLSIMVGIGVNIGQD